MALSPTAQLTNAIDSLKKFFFDNYTTTEGVSVTFDRLLPPGTAVTEWLSVIFGDFSVGTVSRLEVNIYCCTKADREAYDLVRLIDTVTGYFYDDTKTDGLARIVLYQSDAILPWVPIGALLVTSSPSTEMFYAMDNVKYKIINCEVRFPSLI